VVLSAYTRSLLSLDSQEGTLPKRYYFGLPVTWCLFVFALFSLSRNKQEYYIAPMYPVAAVLSGILDRAFRKWIGTNTGFVDSVGRPFAWMWTHGFLAALLLFILLYSFILSSFMPGISPVLHYGPSLVLAAGVLLLAWSIVRKAYVQCFSSRYPAMDHLFDLCTFVFAGARVIPAGKELHCKIIEAQSMEMMRRGIMEPLPSMVFYLRRPIFEENSPEQMAQRFNPRNASSVS
jgi:4-amino-4-deoxy-L-arabinose transferase-like glycosyltransferase